MLSHLQGVRILGLTVSFCPSRKKFQAAVDSGPSGLETSEYSPHNSVTIQQPRWLAQQGSGFISVDMPCKSSWKGWKMSRGSALPGYWHRKTPWRPTAPPLVPQGYQISKGQAQWPSKALVWFFSKPQMLALMVEVLKQAGETAT